MFIKKFRKEGYNGIADKALEHKEEMIQYFLKNKWTISDMTDHTWRTDYDGYYLYGKVTNNDLINTNGVRIYSDGVVGNEWLYCVLN